MNEMVMEIKETGDFNGLDFNTLVKELLPKVEAKAHHFLLQERYINLSIDPYDLVSVALYENLTKRIRMFDGTGTFEGYFFRYLNDAFMDAIRPYMTKKRAINTFPADSLDREIDGEGTMFGEQFANVEPEADFTEAMVDALEMFEEEYGKEARQVVLCHAYFEGKERTQAICKVYGVDEYNSTIRKRVQRTMERFTSLLQGVK